jgi:hypothetical protein
VATLCQHASAATSNINFSANGVGDMGHPLCVLVVDGDWAEAWCLLLAQWGHRPILAYDAAAALAVALAKKAEAEAEDSRAIEVMVAFARPVDQASESSS